MNIVACDYEHHAAPILAILNQAIVSSTALFDYKPRAPETMVEWFRAKTARQLPVLGAVADDGALTSGAPAARTAASCRALVRASRISDSAINAPIGVVATRPGRE